MSSDATEGSEFSFRPWDDPFRSQRRPGSPSPPHCYDAPSRKKARRRHRDLDKATRRPEEGRLAYDDEIDALGPKTSCSSATDPSQHILSISEEEVIGPASPSVMVTPEDLGEIKDKTEDFLRALAADIMLKDGDNSRSMVVDTYDVEIGVDSSPSREICIDDSNRSDSPNEAESPAVQAIPRPKRQLVQCPPFSSKITSLFYTRENPIINVRTNRKTASQMMKISEVFRTPRSKQADEGTTASSLPHRPRGGG
ncbi:hypothetical protein E0Z10_g4593 [Xylaria hypoxylon]|uniref:Uncharacterized protein n=1 Tax=Xylaria hypoxylon TaxID=37992 RepID=A0A4Z0YKQ4_9PEZI|nr:hypothetical protein E0Z10_g4593 [Xylaria hypoxylon]